MAAPLTFIDSDFSVARGREISLEAPFRDLGVNTDYILRQMWYQNLADFTPLAIGTAHPDAEYSDYTLMQEDPLTNLGGGVVEWLRTYAKLPESFDKPEDATIYVFPAFGGNVQSAGIPPFFRPARSETVPLVITRDFFQTDNPLDDIPVIPAFSPTLDGYPDVVADALYDAPPFTVASVPTRTEYEAMIAAEDLLVSEASSYAVWLGNIFMRQTRKVRAQ